MYKDIVNTIRNLRWEQLSEAELQLLMILSGYAAREFAESLRKTCELPDYRDSAGLKKMAAEELKTNNLQFGDYEKAGDHADFLWHFIEKSNLLATCPKEIIEAGEAYLVAVRALPAETRAMSIVSREQELPGIFEQILRAKEWSSDGLSAFRYYLERHILLDRQGGGHADLLAGFKVDERVAAFYAARLEMYRCLPTLFG